MKKAPTFPNVAVVGMHFRKEVDAKSIVANFIPPVDLTYEREPENLYDSYAIKIFYDSVHIGYVEATQACYIAPYIDDGVEFIVVVTDMEQRKRNLHPIATFTPVEQTEHGAETGETETA